MALNINLVVIQGPLRQGQHIHQTIKQRVRFVVCFSILKIAKPK